MLVGGFTKRPISHLPGMKSTWNILLTVRRKRFFVLSEGKLAYFRSLRDEVRPSDHSSR